MKTRIDFWTLIAYFAIVIIASLLINHDLGNDPVVPDITIQDIPGMQATPVSDSTGHITVQYR